MHKFIKKLSITLLVTAVFLAAFYHLWLKGCYTVPVLMYHRISNDMREESITVKPDSFTRQMAYIKWRKYNVISLNELVEGIKNKRAFKHNTVVITFDDGYQDNYTSAYPVLKGYNFPATIFLISSYIDSEDFLKKDQMTQMLKGSKITFGAHTRNHAYLPDIKDKGRLNEEISGSKSEIEALTGEQIDYFCYPTGGFSDDIKKIVRESGYKGACTTNRGFAKLNEDVYELKRIKVKNSDFTENPLSFWLKLSGYYNIFRKGKEPY